MMERKGKARRQPMWKEGWPLCPACNGKHILNVCQKFYEDMSLAQRKKMVSENNRCFRCLSPLHTISECRRDDHCFCGSNLHHPGLHDWNKQSTMVGVTDRTYRSVGDSSVLIGKSALRMNTISYGVCFLKNPVTGERLKINCNFLLLIPKTL